MSTNQNTNKNNNEPSFDEYLAYEELRMIFVIAIETQNFGNIEARITSWEKKYPLAEFKNPEIIRKIKAILDKDFLSRLLGDYMAAKILHEQEKQKELYNELKKIIDNARKSKDYKSAQREVRKWKDNLHSNGFSLYNFDRVYRARVCTLLLLPSKELENQAQATDELKKIKENGNSMDSKAYFEAISNWQNTYSICDFPDKLKKEINQITTEVFDSISQKRSRENALAEIQDALTSKDKTPPLDAISSILSKYDYKRFDETTRLQIEALSIEAVKFQESVFDGIDLLELPSISSTEAQALLDLKAIINKTPNDTDKILNWIYLNRKISYSEFARNEILKQFSSAGYIIPKQNSFSIPEINPNLNYSNTSKIDELRKDVILNYLGILSQGQKLTIEGKDNLIEVHAISAEEVLAKKENTPVMFLEAFDTIVEQHEEKQQEQIYDENGEIVYDNEEEEKIYNIFIEDIMEDPLVTFSITAEALENQENFSVDKEVTLSNETVLEEATETEEEHQTEISIENKLQETSTSVQEAVMEESPELEEQPQTEATIENGNDKTYLTDDDNNNLEQAYNFSTYIVVATPILEQALTQKKERSRKKTKDIERII